MPVAARDVSDAITSAVCWVIAQGVAVEHWPREPSDPGDADGLHRRPLLYLVAEGEAPPTITDEFATWVQLPAEPDDLLTRARMLMGRAQRAGLVLAYVDDEDVLRVDNRLVVLSPIEARMMRMLLDRVGSVVSRERINQEIWPDKAPDDFGTLNGRVKLLRAHIEKLPLRIHTVRGRGLLLEVAPRSNRFAPDVFSSSEDR